MHSKSNGKSRSIVDRFYFPPPGQELENQDQRQPEEIGLDPAIVSQINQYLVYLDSSGSVDVKVSGEEYQVRWINAQNILDRRDGGITSSGENLVAPDDADDWLLYLISNGAEFCGQRETL